MRIKKKFDDCSDYRHWYCVEEEGSVICGRRSLRVNELFHITYFICQVEEFRTADNARLLILPYTTNGTVKFQFCTTRII